MKNMIERGIPMAKNRKSFYERLSPHEKRFVDKDRLRMSKAERKKLISDVFHRRIKVK